MAVKKKADFNAPSDQAEKVGAAAVAPAPLLGTYSKDYLCKH